MIKKYKNLFVVLFMLWMIFVILFNRELIYETISYSLKVWVHNLIPSMFPFFVVSDILLCYHVSEYIPKFIVKFFSKVFNVSNTIIVVFFLSMLSGMPNNARIIAMMLRNNEISLDDANHVLIFTHFPNPSFVFSVVGVFFLHNSYYGIIIYISIILGNLILGFITRNYINHYHIDYTKKSSKSQNISLVFIQAVRRSIDSLLLILGIITCFLICSAIIISKLSFSSYTNAIIQGIFEITMGIKAISNLGISDLYKVVISAMLISFGGISVHMQIISQIIDTDISYHTFFLARIFHAILSGIISFIIFLII